jgi:hypothetical protein
MVIFAVILFQAGQETVERRVELLAAFPKHQMFAHDDEFTGRCIRFHPIGDDLPPLFAHHKQQR